MAGKVQDAVDSALQQGLAAYRQDKTKYHYNECPAQVPVSDQSAGQILQLVTEDETEPSETVAALKGFLRAATLSSGMKTSFQRALYREQFLVLRDQFKGRFERFRACIRRESRRTSDPRLPKTVTSWIARDICTEKNIGSLERGERAIERFCNQLEHQEACRQKK